MLNKLTNDAIIEKRPCRRKAEGPFNDFKLLCIKFSQSHLIHDLVFLLF